jgi:hypothetical protein
MGAIARDGYVFEMEYSVIANKGAIHVFKDGEFISELPFHYDESTPNEEKIEQMIDAFVNGDIKS